jgi:hypothetical protein
LLHQLKYKPDQLYSVFVAFRDVAKNAKEYLPENTILLERDVLVKLYSPTLASRPQFLSENKGDK